jgi:hypothetical protein
MKLYTARYANRNLVDHPAAKVRITVGAPRFRLPYQLAGSIADLAPRRDMFGKTPAEFRALYRTLLEQRGGAPTIAKHLTATAERAGVDALVLCCFERLDPPTPGVFCHRRIFAELWQEWTGEVVEEIEEAA